MGEAKSSVPLPCHCSTDRNSTMGGEQAIADIPSSEGCSLSLCSDSGVSIEPWAGEVSRFPQDTISQHHEKPFEVWFIVLLPCSVGRM